MSPNESYENVNILLIEDDQIDVRAIQRALAQQKISNPLVVAKDGIEALEILRGQNGYARLNRPLLILLDLNLPRLSGLSFLKELRGDPELHDNIVFVLTTSNSDEDRASAYNEHIAGYMLKDTVGEDFLSVIQLLENYVVTIQFPMEINN